MLGRGRHEGVRGIGGLFHMLSRAQAGFRGIRPDTGEAREGKIIFIRRVFFRPKMC